MLESETVIAVTRAWLEQVVIGLGLCPFAKAVHVKGQIRYFVSHAETPEALLALDNRHGGFHCVCRAQRALRCGLRGHGHEPRDPSARLA